ncbi:MAG TPA: hypothetical protein VNG90_00260 [Candidatus Acidoferrum sp.]|nr:hypothetical protein [Candidatus Acidoferrum sp.]
MDTRYFQQLYAVLAMLGLINEQEAAANIASLASVSLGGPLPWYLDGQTVQHVYDVMLEADQQWLEAWISQQLLDFYAIASCGVAAVKTNLPDGRVQIFVQTCRQAAYLMLTRMPTAEELLAQLGAQPVLS